MAEFHFQRQRLGGKNSAGKTGECGDVCAGVPGILRNWLFVELVIGDQLVRDYCRIGYLGNWLGRLLKLTFSKPV